jgi:hypothetical protein
MRKSQKPVHFPNQPEQPMTQEIHQQKISAPAIALLAQQEPEKGDPGR